MKMLDRGFLRDFSVLCLSVCLSVCVCQYFVVYIAVFIRRCDAWF